MSDIGFAQKKILVIDDEGDILKFARTRLEASGYRVLTLNSGNRAVEFAEYQKPDLILLDIMMPRENGYNVCRRLKANKATSSIPVVLFTAQYLSEECVKADAEEVGAADYIFKPYDAQTILAKIKLLIK